MIKGLFLEGAGWDSRNMCLVEAEPMQMVSAMPAIHFKPVERKKTNKSESVQQQQQLLLLLCLTDISPLFQLCVGMYACPCYYFPVRSGGAGRASFVVSVELMSGAVNPDHWIKRGTALLMSLDH